MGASKTFMIDDLRINKKVLSQTDQTYAQAPQVK